MDLPKQERTKAPLNDAVTLGGKSMNWKQDWPQSLLMGRYDRLLDSINLWGKKWLIKCAYISRPAWPENWVCQVSTWWLIWSTPELTLGPTFRSSPTTENLERISQTDKIKHTLNNTSSLEGVCEMFLFINGSVTHKDTPFQKNQFGHSKRGWKIYHTMRSSIAGWL